MSNRKKFKVSFVIDTDMDDVSPMNGETKEQAVINMMKDLVPTAAMTDDDIVTEIICEPVQ